MGTDTGIDWPYIGCLDLLESGMRTTLALDDELLAKAQALTGISEKAALVREALRALIQRESAKRLALLGGSEPQLEAVRRRQTEAG
jgi:Arc/MetJ family transcription regulator